MTTAPSSSRNRSRRCRALPRSPFSAIASPSIRVQVDPAKLAATGLTLEEIRGMLIASTSNNAKGSINTEKRSFTIAANDQITEAEQFDDVVLAYRNGAPIRVRDVGSAVRRS